jgi:uncharacterized protein
MSRDSIIRTIRAHEGELRELGVKRMALFGSAARDDGRGDSDVDVLIDVDFERPFTFIEYFDVRDRLREALGREVDVVMQGAVKPRFAKRIADDLVPIF